MSTLDVNVLETQELHYEQSVAPLLDDKVIAANYMKQLYNLQWLHQLNQLHFDLKLY